MRYKEGETGNCRDWSPIANFEDGEGGAGLSQGMKVASRSWKGLLAAGQHGNADISPTTSKN